MKNMKQKMKEQENQKLQKIQEEEENEEKLKQEAINLLSNEMKKEYKAKIKDLESNISSPVQDQYEKGNKRKWSFDENIINAGEIHNDSISNNHSRQDTSDSLRQSQLLNNRVDQETIIEQVTKNIMSRSKSQTNLNEASTSQLIINNENSLMNVEENNNDNTVNNINNNDDNKNIPSTSAAPIYNNKIDISNKIKDTNLDKNSTTNHQNNNEPSLMNIEILNDKVDTISIALNDEGEFKLKENHKSSQQSINENSNNVPINNSNVNVTDSVHDNNATYEPLLSFSPFQLPSSPQLPPSQPEIVNPFNLYFGFKKSTGIFGNLMSTTTFSNDELLKNISAQMAGQSTNQNEINNGFRRKSTLNNDISTDNNNDDDNNDSSPKLRVETLSPKIRLNINDKYLNSSNSSSSSSSSSTINTNINTNIRKANNSNGNGLKPELKKGKSYQNLQELNIFTTDSGDEISMIGDNSKPEESSLGYSLNQSLNLFNNQNSVHSSTNKVSLKYEKRTKPTQDLENNDVLNDSEIIKKAKQNAKDSLLKFIPKIIDENINTKELRIFKYNFDNFDFSNIILMNNYLNNAKQINSLQTKLQQEQQSHQQQSPEGQLSENKETPLDTSLNSSLDENYEISAPFSSIFEHTVIHAITKQNEIIDFSVMNYFMTNLEFVQQLKSLSSFYLMNDGNYVCQLKSILFDSRNGINVLKVNNPLKLNYNLIVNNLNSNSLISSSTNFLFTNNNKITSDSKYLILLIIVI